VTTDRPVAPRVSEPVAQKLGGRFGRMSRARENVAPDAIPDDRVESRGRHNLPILRTRLIGRDQDVRAVRRAVLAAEGHLVTLTGAGGCGKTRLALQAGFELMDAFAEGVWLAELAPIADPSLIPQAVARAIGVVEQPDRSLLDTLITSLGGHQVLLVLDNCEHLVDASAHLAERLLDACAGLRILATSREPLRLSSEVAWPVAPLAAPNARWLPAEPEVAGRYPAVQLFVERARAAQPAFALTLSNTTAVAQICAGLDGLPLALELAAARTRALTAEQIAARLSDMFRVLAEAGPTAPSRQRTLRATFDWSHGLLSATEQALFRRLAVFAGGWTLEAAEAVCAGDGVAQDEVLELLAHLVDRSLVVAEESSSSSATMRYRLLEPTRQYAAQRLQASGEADRTKRRHTTCFLDLANAGDDLWRGPWELAWLERMDRDQDNLRTALQHTWEHGDLEAHLLLCIRLTRFWEVRGFLEEGRRWLERGLTHAETVSPVLRMRATGRAAYLASHQGAYDQLGLLSDAWFALARQLGDEAAAAEARDYQAYCLAVQGDVRSAATLVGQSLAFFRTRKDQVNLGANLMNLGWILLQRGDLQRARELFDEVVPLARAAEDPVQEAIGLAGLSFLAYSHGDVPTAARLARQALALVHDIGHPRYIGFALDLLGVIAAAQGQTERAGRLFGAAEGVLEHLHSHLGWREMILRPLHDRQVTAAQSGPAAERFAAAWANGRALPLEEAVAYASADDELPLTAAGRTPAERGPLSPREREVAALVAQGLSNREIASQLVITERTAGAHVEHILDKLGFASRTQIGVWAAERGLVISGLS